MEIGDKLIVVKEELRIDKQKGTKLLHNDQFQEFRRRIP